MEGITYCYVVSFIIHTNLFEKEKEKEIYENEESGICANDGK